MSSQPLPTQATVAAPAAANDAGPVAGQAAGQGTTHQHIRAVLLDLIDMGHDIARTVHAQAMRAEAQAQATAHAEATPDAGPAAAHAPDAPPPTPDLPARFDRISRCVRRTVLLVQHMDQPPRPARATSPDRAAARKRILRRCEDHIALAAFNNRRRPGRIDAGALHTELLERLDSPELAEDLDTEIATRPIPDIITDLCRDLGLGLDDMPGTCPTPRRTPRDIATLIARAHAPPGTAPRHPAPHLIPNAPPKPVPDQAPAPDEPPGMDDMLALCAALVRDG